QAGAARVATTIADTTMVRARSHDSDTCPTLASNTTPSTAGVTTETTSQPSVRRYSRRRPGVGGLVAMGHRDSRPQQMHTALASPIASGAGWASTGIVLMLPRGAQPARAEAAAYAGSGTIQQAITAQRRPRGTVASRLGPDERSAPAPAAASANAAAYCQGLATSRVSGSASAIAQGPVVSATGGPHELSARPTARADTRPK